MFSGKHGRIKIDYAGFGALMFFCGDGALTNEGTMR